MTKSGLKNNNVRFKFEYITNGQSNNFYLDNIMIGEESSLLLEPSNSLQRISVFPNPTVDNTNIIIENVLDNNLDVNIVNVLGKKVKSLFSGIVLDNSLQLSTNLTYLDRGIYFINVYSEGVNILTEKVILNK